MSKRAEIIRPHRKSKYVVVFYVDSKQAVINLVNGFVLPPITNTKYLIEKMSKRAEAAAYNYAKENGTLGYDYNQIYDAAKNGYEQAEKDIEALILKFLDRRNDRDYATVGWIKKHFNEYKRQILENEQ